MRCLVEGCQLTPFEPKSFCSFHWAKIPGPVQSALYKSYFRASGEFVAAAWLKAASEEAGTA